MRRAWAPQMASNPVQPIGCRDLLLSSGLLVALATSCAIPVVLTREMCAVGLYVLDSKIVEGAVERELKGVGLCWTSATLSVGYQHVRCLSVAQTDLGGCFQTPWLAAWTGQAAESAASSSTLQTPRPELSQ